MAQQLLFIHGAGGDARTWGPVMDQLPATLDTRAITLTYFGTGAWPDDGSAFGTERHAADIIDYIEAAMEPPVHVVAWSYGVHPTLLAALRRPDLFGAILAFEPGLATYIDGKDEQNALKQGFVEAFGPVISALGSDGPEGAVKAMFDSLGGDGCFDTLPSYLQDITLSNAPMMPLLLGNGRAHASITTADLGAMALPVTAIMGDSTRSMFEVTSRALAGAAGKGTLLVAQDADHMLPVKKPERFASLVHDWLNAMESTL